MAKRKINRKEQQMFNRAENVAFRLLSEYDIKVPLLSQPIFWDTLRDDEEVELFFNELKRQKENGEEVDVIEALISVNDENEELLYG